MTSRRDFNVGMMTEFPRLRDFRITSEPTCDYNCIGWGAGEDDRWWEPNNPDGYWPEGVPASMAPKALEAAYATIGYARCNDGTLEPGFEKIALFVGSNGKWSHAARQLPSGRWTSKMGKAHDIEHDLPTMSGGAYGTIWAYMRRSKP